jgi:hypothetical protein
MKTASVPLYVPRFLCILLGRHALALRLMLRTDGRYVPVARCVSCGAGS